MNSGVNIKVPYVPLKKMSFRQSISTSTSNVINALTDFLRTFISSSIYQKYTMIMCFILLLNLFMNFFLKSYTHSITLTIQAIVCCIIILDMFSNVLVYDINYILTASYYYDMFLIVSSIVTIALLIITHAYSTTISMTWLRIELSLQSLKYIIPTIKWILQNQHDKKIQILQEQQQKQSHSKSTIPYPVS